MNPFIEQWSQSQDAQPFIQQASQNLGMSGGAGQSGFGQDPYSQYIQQLISANGQNPAFQKQLQGYFLDFNNPMNQFENQYAQDKARREEEMAMKEMLLNTGISYVSSDDPETKLKGYNIIDSVLAGSGYTAGGKTTSVSDMGPDDFRKTALANRYGPMIESETDPEKLTAYSMLAGGNEGAMDTYYGADPSFWDRFGAWVLPFGENWWDTKASTGTREKAVRNAYAR